MYLQEWCKKNELGYKILLADNVANVNRLKRIANREGTMITNLEGVRIPELAKRIVIEKLALDGKINKIDLADRDICVLILNKLIRDDSKRKKRSYSFVPVESMCLETAEEILRVMNVIRMGKTTSEYKSTTAVKEKEVKKLIKDYEKELNAKCLYDDVLLIKEAISALKSKAVKVESEIGILEYMIPKLSFLENQFMKKLAKNYITIDYKTEDAKTNASFYDSYGQFNEVQTIVNIIEREKLPFGQVNILFSSSEYETMIKTALNEKGIPCSFAGGYSILDNSYVSLLRAIINWAKDNYSYESFRAITGNKLVKCSGKEYRYGAKVGIGWGIDRYALFVDKMKNDKKAYQELLLKHHRIREDEDVDKYMEYVDFIDRIVALIADIDKEPYDIGVVYRKMISFIDNNVEHFDMEKPAFTVMKAKRNYFDYMGNVDSFDEALSIIDREIVTLKMTEEEESNAVTAMSMGSVNVLERPYQFLIGLSYESFGSGAIDSPVITDDRLLQLVDESAGYVDSRLTKVIDKKDNLINTLSSLSEGDIHITRSGYDTINLRDVSQSEAYIILKDMYGVNDVKKIGYDNVSSLENTYTIDKSKVFPVPKKTTKEEGQDDDGKDEEEKDPFGYVKVVNEDGRRIVKLEKLSPTALSNLMECPWKYDYYIKYYPDENEEMDVTSWLNPADRGTFFHEVLEQYCNEKLVGKTVSKTDKPDIDCLKKIYDKEISDFEVLVAKGSEQAFAWERRYIWETTVNYIEDLYKNLAKEDKKWSVKKCERKFETDAYYINEDGEYVDKDYKKDVIEVTFHGTLDRIDTCIVDGEEHARIVDYKTGKKKSLEDKIKKNTQIQHAIYSMAAKETVDEFSYDFPFDNNDKTIKQGDDITDLPIEYRKRMADVFLKDDYKLLDDDACTYCNHKDICIYRMNLD